jgi:hypothetical protein
MGCSGIEEIIAERKLTLLDESGRTSEVIVRLGKPRMSAEADDFSCEVHIAGFNDDKISRIFGLDAFQAIQLALRYISVSLQLFRERSGQALYWTSEGDDMGFPEQPAQ